MSLLLLCYDYVFHKAINLFISSQDFAEPVNSIMHSNAVIVYYLLVLKNSYELVSKKTTVRK